MLLLTHSLGTYNETSTQWWYEDTDFVEPTDAELGVTDELQSRFASFAKTGSPNNNVYTGWPEVPFTGANSNGAATRVSQFFFPLNQGGYVQNSASLLAAGAPVDRCSAFPNFRPFSVITESPSYASYIVGMDFSGNPTRGSFAGFLPCFEAARREGLLIAAHVGEIDHEADTDAILSFRPERLGHALLLTTAQKSRLSTKPIPIEICPTSNLKTLQLDNLQAHPTMAQWLRLSYPISISTDDSVEMEIG